MNHRTRAVLGVTAGSAGLVALFCFVLKPNPAGIASMIASVPWQVYAGVAGIELVNLLACAQKWRISVRYFRPGVPTRTLFESLEATVAGSVLGQVLPYQPSVAAARAIMEHKGGGKTVAVWTTFHEQSFDLLALATVGALSPAVFGLGLGPTAAILLVGAGSLLAVIWTQASLSVCARVAASTRNLLKGRLTRPADAFVQVLREAAAAPWQVCSALMALSLLRLALILVRLILVLRVIVPAASLYTIAVGFPAVQFLSALPLTAGGFGVAEWSWTGVLMRAGATAQDSSEAAIALRVIGLVAFSIIPSALLLRRLVAVALRRTTRVAMTWPDPR